MGIFTSIIGIVFIFINLMIITSDIKKKIIPNKYLFYLILLLPLYYISLPFFFNQPLSLSFAIQILISLFVSFGLFYYGIWGAGDAKYLLVLSLYLPHIGIIPFIANVALLTLLYLGSYFILFYIKKMFGFIILRSNKSKQFITFIGIDIFDKFSIKFKNEDETGYRGLIIKISKWLLQFLVLFFTLRLGKLYIFDTYIVNNYERLIQQNEFLKLLYDNPSYFFLGIFVLIIIFYFIISRLYFFITKLIYKFTKKYIIAHFNIHPHYTKDIVLFSFTGLFLIFLVFEAIIDFNILIKNLYIILSYYLMFYIIIKILIYSYKLTFQQAEEEMIFIRDLKKGDLIDKKYIITHFENEYVLGAYGNKKGFMYPSPKKFIFHLDNPLDKYGVKNIKKAYRILSDINKQRDKIEKGHEPLNTIKVLKTFAFGGYVFGGFFITFFYSDTIFQKIIDFIFGLIKNFYNL